MGYNESSKAYIIYISGSRQIEVSRDVTFEREMVVRKGRGSYMHIDDEEMLGSQEMRLSTAQAQREITDKNEPIDTIDPIETAYDPRDIAIS